MHLEGSCRHPEYDGSFPVLNESSSSKFLYGLEAECAVITHSGEQYAQRSMTVGGCE
jgi:hypothetical protein